MKECQYCEYKVFDLIEHWMYDCQDCPKYLLEDLLLGQIND